VKTNDPAGFVYSPSAQVPSEDSSPLAVQGSSPTARVSLRRATNRMHAPSTYTQTKDQLENASHPETPRQQDYAPTKNTPQTLALGHAPPMAHGIQLISPHDLSIKPMTMLLFQLLLGVARLHSLNWQFAKLWKAMAQDNSRLFTRHQLSHFVLSVCETGRRSLATLTFNVRN